MPEITKEMLIRTPLDSAWALVSDMERFSLCIPGCSKVTKISDTEFDWDLETKVLHTTRKAKARTRTVALNSPTHAEFVGEGRLFERSNHYKLQIKGTTDLVAVEDGITRIRFAGDVRASGIGGAIIDKVAGGQMDELFQQFEHNLKQALGDTGEPIAVEQAGATEPGSAAAPARAAPSVWFKAAVIGAAALLAAALLYLLN